MSSEQDTAAKNEPVDDGASPNLESIMHIPLQVSVELGRINMPLHMVARLARGTVVDMQKEAGASVDICANGKVFAKGEVVSADGKLGVRILEVTSTGDRIRSLG
ncbi:MAG: flagellar motor switch protein FliN [Zetaproteobacteria bacterium CG11_big_fil_rev_8_21_14_0_20_59_439]|nr:MAG: flagellar motor switch protein FliN [Zetaproteobacteria bacterium CG11_big_fil_rev_8_21_14_0_20_59_439]